jgi:hypothetical protein
MVVTLTLVLITSFAAILQIYGSLCDKNWCFNFAFLASVCSIIIGGSWILFNLQFPRFNVQTESLINILFIGFGVSQIYYMYKIGKLPK